MQGQWIGNFEIEGARVSINIDIDEDEDAFQGHFSVTWSKNGQLQRFGLDAGFRVEPKALDARLVIDPVVIDLETASRLPQPVARATFPDEPWPGRLHIELRDIGSHLVVRWRPETGAEGGMSFEASRASRPSEIEADLTIRTWDQFRTHVLSLPPRTFVFRGQAKPHRLRTTFHRSRRKDLWRYQNEDVPEVRRALIGTTKSLFRLSDAEEAGAFFHMLQHHGYPTPMLDWSKSPYVAAFFAFSNAQMSADHPTVRIFKFNRAAWQRSVNQLPHAAHHTLHFSFIDVLPIDNPRAAPQQAISALTNIDDIEGYIRTAERLIGQRLLEAYDISLNEHHNVMRELELAGVTPGALFPGIEGVCADYRTRHFGFSPANVR